MRFVFQSLVIAKEDVHKNTKKTLKIIDNLIHNVKYSTKRKACSVGICFFPHRCIKLYFHYEYNFAKNKLTN